jgi:peptidoglycan/xylan/chitin deacetylase (PgdA/CDA1 family)
MDGCFHSETHGMLQRLAKTGVAGLMHWTGADTLIGALNGSRHEPLIIGYHSVVEDFAAGAEGYMPSMLISQRMLERQLDWIGRRYRFISLDELGMQLESGIPFEKPVAAVTFDDGYRDFYDHAFPLLLRKGIPAAVFVVTDLLGTSRLLIYDKLYLLLVRAFTTRRFGLFDPFHFLLGLGIRLPDVTRMCQPGDPHAVMRALYTVLPQTLLYRVVDALEADSKMDESTLRERHTLSWAMLSEMHRAGVVIGSHTKTHALLPNENWQAALEQTLGSKQDLERKLGITIRHFAYPNGSFNTFSVPVVANAGYHFAYTTCSHRDLHAPLLTIPRKLLWERSCMDAFERFSPSIMSCLVHGVFDFTAPCAQDHRSPGMVPPMPDKGSRKERDGSPAKATPRSTVSDSLHAARPQPTPTLTHSLTERDDHGIDL